jgi:hypothetical protein
MESCTNCGLDRDEHRSYDLACPAGSRTCIGWTSYSQMQRYTLQPQSQMAEDDTSSSLLNTIVATELISSALDSTPSIDTSFSSSDFGGFDGGSSGGGGSDSSR